jgi:hypothetical protein
MGAEGCSVSFVFVAFNTGIRGVVEACQLGGTRCSTMMVEKQ